MKLKEIVSWLSEVLAIVTRSEKVSEAFVDFFCCATWCDDISCLTRDKKFWLINQFVKVGHACFSCWESSISVNLIIWLVVYCVKGFVTWGHFLQQIVSNWVTSRNPRIIFWWFRVSILYDWLFTWGVVADDCWAGFGVKDHLHGLGSCCCLLLITCVKFFNCNSRKWLRIRKNYKINFILKFLWVLQINSKSGFSQLVFRLFPCFF